eukprot:6529379-Karenia_brevis.AAC.1
MSEQQRLISQSSQGQSVPRRRLLRVLRVRMLSARLSMTPGPFGREPVGPSMCLHTVWREAGPMGLWSML